MYGTAAKMNAIAIATFLMMKFILQDAAEPDVTCPPSTGLGDCDMCDEISGSSCLCGRLAVVCNGSLSLFFFFMLKKNEFCFVTLLPRILR